MVKRQTNLWLTPLKRFGSINDKAVKEIIFPHAALVLLTYEAAFTKTAPFNSWYKAIRLKEPYTTKLWHYQRIHFLPITTELLLKTEIKVIYSKILE